MATSTLNDEQIRAAAASITGAKRRPTTKQRERLTQKRATIAEIKARAASRQSVIEAETQARATRRTERAAFQESQARQVSGSQRLGQATQVATTPLAGESQLSAPKGSSWLMVAIGTFFALIVLYIVISKPQPTGTFLASLSTWLHTISSPAPLFTNVATGG